MKKFTFHNSGTSISFVPTRESNGETLLAFYQDLVRTAGRRDVYIMDNKGREVDCTLSPTAQAA